MYQEVEKIYHSVFLICKIRNVEKHLWTNDLKKNRNQNVKKINLPEVYLYKIKK